MPRIVINGNKLLSGEIFVSGAKNSVVALIPAAILCDDVVTINNVPNISDVDDLEDILKYLGVNVIRGDNSITIDNSGLMNKSIGVDLSSKLRASYYFMGALLGRFNKSDICFPGGCSIGKRPINLHLMGFSELGASIREDDGHFIITADKIIGKDIFLDFPSVGATINILLAAVKGNGKTVIDNAAMEPEVSDVCYFLNEMGAKISGVGTSRLEIEGVTYLHSCSHSVIPDRIEAGTFVIIASLLGNGLKVCGINLEHIYSLILKLKEAGVEMEIGSDYIYIDKVLKYNAIDVKTEVYPGFPTDLQQPITPFLVSCDGISHIEENIYENRFQNIPDVIKMGAKIEISSNNKIATIYGRRKLVGKEVTATDLRGGASMIVCGLVADGETVINNIHFILRGYDNIINKLQGIGASIYLVND